ncbi:hypothetical protein [Saccharothrix lopnurensis]|uniref:Uncharacterized protein n=1 Tax=Saccharothrix lopnurensis TaxID=1670621 RepID=A0ABW1NXD4_9PSEU
MEFRGAGDESLLWSGMCERFATLAQEARRYGRDAWWDRVVASSRRGSADVRDARALLADLAELRGHLLDFGGRDGEWPVTSARDAAHDAHACPTRLCRRRSVAPPGAPAPRCALLDRPMTDPLG